MTDPNRAWLDGLKPGDTVAMRGGRFEAVWHVLTVVRRTPKQIVLHSTSSSGELRAWSDDGALVRQGPLRHIEPLTERIRAKMRRTALISTLRSLAWEALETETLEAVAALLQARRAPGERG